MSTGVSRDDRAAGRVDQDPYASDPARPLASAARPWWRWLFLVPGLAAVAWGVAGLLGAGDRVPLPAWAVWFLGSALLHDVVIAPLVVLVGALLARLLPRPARAPIAVGLVVCGVLTLVALPFALDPGGVPEPGFLPQDYSRNLLLLVAGTLAVAGTWAAVRTRRRSRGRAGQPSGEETTPVPRSLR
ncbi:hypothetical protein [Blastococcus saxobsidens]|uniref:Uncharacterized protein n=1 Tax=Blastococcus saxobsidens TaxID=138336 RepID=A0A4Q7Y2V2_9ACTN|nr:hypothetical protein [Blastococcus saxobsidens]RZU30401.1 hypothetical protein BKA19_0017 [Blastococcus saxobsidens]